MALEQQMERSEELLETNDENKERVEQAKDQVRRADNQVNAAQAQVRYAQLQLQQAIADRNAAEERASQEENGSVPASYDAAVASAEAELRSAQRELEESRRERIEADRELHNAEGALAESTQALHNVASELQQVSEKYGVNLSRTSQLMNLPYSQLASPLMQQLGIGKDRLDDLRMRIAASLGIAAAATGGGYGGGGGYSGGGRRAGGVSGSYGGYGSGYNGGGASGTNTPGSSGPLTTTSGGAASTQGGAAKQQSSGNGTTTKTINGEKHYYDSSGVLYRVGDSLLPNTISVIKGYQITTDELGRKSCVEGKLRLRERDRLHIKDSMDVVGKGDQRSNDDRGHLIADLFDGPNGMENLVPQNSVLNRGDFKKFEGELADLIRDGNEVYARIEPYYEGDSNRPTELAVFYHVNGEPYIRIFQNE